MSEDAKIRKQTTSQRNRSVKTSEWLDPIGEECSESLLQVDSDDGSKMDLRATIFRAPSMIESLPVPEPKAESEVHSPSEPKSPPKKPIISFSLGSLKKRQISLLINRRKDPDQLEEEIGLSPRM